MWLYGVATALTLTGTILEGIAAAKKETENVAEKKTLVAVEAEALKKGNAACQAAALKTIKTSEGAFRTCSFIQKEIPASFPWMLACDKIKTTAKTDASLSLQACVFSVTAKAFLSYLMARIAEEKNPATPGDQTCEPKTTTVDFSDPSSASENIYVENFIKFFNNFWMFKKVFANRVLDHETRFWNPIYSTLGGFSSAMAVYSTSWLSQDYFHKENLYRFNIFWNSNGASWCKR